jgi:ComF family protein
MAASPLSSFGPLFAAGRAVLDLLAPPQCLACGEAIAAADALCARCWPALRFIDAPMCACCGLPLDFELGAGAVCGACAGHSPDFRRARAALVYDDASRPLILAFKNRDRTDAAPAFARWMTRAGAGLLAEADLLVPVPLHWTRLWARRFNQAALLAYGIGRLAGVPVLPDALVRLRRTGKMGLLGRTARARNVAGVFAVRPGAAGRLAARRIVLVDDVLTTGATVGGCVRALKAAGVASVDVLALARAVRDATAGEPAAAGVSTAD